MQSIQFESNWFLEFCLFLNFISNIYHDRIPVNTAWSRLLEDTELIDYQCYLQMTIIDLLR